MCIYTLITNVHVHVNNLICISVCHGREGICAYTSYDIQCALYPDDWIHEIPCSRLREATRTWEQKP